MNVICYTRQDDGGVSVIVPASECGLSLDHIAKKDIPPGIDYWILPQSDIPSDRSGRDAWELDINTAPSGSGLDFGIGSEWDVMKISDNKTYYYVRRTNRDKAGEVVSYDHRIVNALTNEVVATTQRALEGQGQLEQDNGSENKPAKESRTRKKKTKR